MTLLDRLERHLSQWAIPGLIRYVVGLNALVFLLTMLHPGYRELLTMDRDLIMKGEVWRLISWIFVPSGGLFWMYCYLSFTWWAGDSLESTWGTFRVNLYYLLGVIGCIIAAMVFGSLGSNVMLNLTILFAVATLAPNLQMMFLYLIPMQLKWLAFAALFYPVFCLILGDMATRLAVIFCLLNYLLFFGPALLRQAKQNREVHVRRERFEAAKATDETLHCCVTCGLTEITDPHADFRVAEDGQEYCAAHLPKKIPV